LSVEASGISAAFALSVSLLVAVLNDTIPAFLIPNYARMRLAGAECQSAGCSKGNCAALGVRRSGELIRC